MILNQTHRRNTGKAQAINRPIEQELKEDKNIDDEDDIESKNSVFEKYKKVFDYYEQNFGLISGPVREGIDGYLKQGIEVDVLIEGMNIALINNIRRWNYVESVIDNAVISGVKTLSQWEGYQKEFKERVSQRATANRGNKSPGQNTPDDARRGEGDISSTPRFGQVAGKSGSSGS